CPLPPPSFIRDRGRGRFRLAPESACAPNTTTICCRTCRASAGWKRTAKIISPTAARRSTIYCNYVRTIR
ncbi:MAG TPA: hypothetical protein VFX76_07415, partial [Roseiflexaceae bacterium]|nr:hypothetical protein [Roseiflexaceae bacterium]